MSTAAQIRASAKYNKDNTKCYSVKFNKKTDADIIEHLDGIKNRAEYFKNLIRKDIMEGGE